MHEQEPRTRLGTLRSRATALGVNEPRALVAVVVLALAAVLVSRRRTSLNGPAGQD